MRIPTTRTLLAFVLALAVGYAARAVQGPLGSVLAQSRNAQTRSSTEDALAFELSGMGPNTALTVYSPAERTLYVYPAVTQGSTHVNCSFMLHVARAGGAIDRENCAVGSAQ